MELFKFLKRIYDENIKGVDLSKDKETRLSFGKEAEEVIIKDLTDSQIKVKPTESLDKWTAGFDQVWGDLWIWAKGKSIKVDVKRGSTVSLNSLKRFKGTGYLMVSGVSKNAPPNFAKTFFVYASTLRKYIDKVSADNQEPVLYKDARKSKRALNFCILPSGDKGIYMNFDILKAKKDYNSWKITLK